MNVAKPGAPGSAAPSDAARFVAAVVVFVFRGGRLLALRRSPRKDAAPGAWEAISGRVDPGEQPHAAAERESREECGIEVRIEPRPVTSYMTKRNRDDMLVVAYRGRPARGPAAGTVILSDEHDAFAWMTLEEFGGACRFPALVEAARSAARGTARRAVRGAVRGRSKRKARAR